MLTLSRVVMAYVAMDRFESVIKFSMSTLQAVTAAGWVIANLLSVLMAANLSTGFGDVRKSWSTAMSAEHDQTLWRMAHQQRVGRARQSRWFAFRRWLERLRC